MVRKKRKIRRKGQQNKELVARVLEDGDDYECKWDKEMTWNVRPDTFLNKSRGMTSFFEGPELN